MLLGLTVGVHEVAVEVAPEVAVVELRLDGVEAGRMVGPPWRLGLDFGRELQPQRLTATARDAGGSVVGEAEQIVNLRPGLARTSLVFERNAAGRAAAVRVIPHSPTGSAVEVATVTLEGVALAVDDSGRAELPAAEGATPRFVAAEVVFADQTTARAEAVFGGVFGEEVVSELTAVPLDAPGRAPALETLDQHLRVGGSPPRIAAVEEGPVELVAVVDRSAWPHLRSWGQELASRLRVSSRGLPRRGEDGEVVQRWERLPEATRREGALRPGDRLSFVRPSPEPIAAVGGDAGVDPALLHRTRPTGDESGGLHWQLATIRLPDSGRPQALADAVAAAGRWAAESGRRRAVLLVLGPWPDDASAFEVAAVRRFLGRLRVPLVVWYVERAGQGRAQRDARDEKRAAVAAAWGPLNDDVAGVGDLLAACRGLRDLVDRQRVAWVEGAWLPGEVTLATGETGLSLAGAAAPVAPDAR